MSNIQFKFLLLWVYILFSPATKDAYGQCSTLLRNIVVYEGTLDTMFNYGAATNTTGWTVRPTSKASTPYKITNFDDIVAPNLSGLYTYSQIGLLISNATITPTGGPISTAGFYMVYVQGNLKPSTAAKLVVILSGPICSCDRSASNTVTLTCTVTFADHPITPILPIMNCTGNGQSFAKYETNKTSVAIHVNNYTMTITVNSSIPTTYDCTVKFSAPTNTALYPYVAKNAPDFSATFRPLVCAEATTLPTTTLSSTEPILSSTATTLSSTATTRPSTTECNCLQCPSSSSPDQNHTQAGECRSDGTNSSEIYDECVVKAELYAKCDGCCPDTMVCGVVVTLRDDSRWLVHDRLCDDNKCEMVVIDASCMSSDWKSFTERKIIVSGIADYVQAGNSVYIRGLNKTDCSESCKKMMNLP